MFKLALALGYANPDAMLSVMPLRVFREWCIYEQYDPIGEWRADLRMATLASLMANLWAGKKGAPPHKVSQFMPQFRIDSPKTKTPDELYEKIKALNMLFGGEEVGSFVVETDVENGD